MRPESICLCGPCVVSVDCIALAQQLPLQSEPLCILGVRGAGGAASSMRFVLCGLLKPLDRGI